METVGHDVKYAFRGFQRQPAFALTAISALAHPLEKLVTFGDEQGKPVPFRIVGVGGDER